MIISLVAGYVVRPYVDIIILIFSNAWSEYLKEKKKK